MAEVQILRAYWTPQGQSYDVNVDGQNVVVQIPAENPNAVYFPVGLLGSASEVAPILHSQVRDFAGTLGVSRLEEALRKMKAAKEKGALSDRTMQVHPGSYCSEKPIRTLSVTDAEGEITVADVDGDKHADSFNFRGADGFVFSVTSLIAEEFTPQAPGLSRQICMANDPLQTGMRQFLSPFDVLLNGIQI